jgi:uncharacterized membrane protein YdcZ (DUF606 family)
MTVGSTTLLNGLKLGPLAVVLFLVPFYLCLVTTKILLAHITDRFKTFMSSRAYIYTLRMLGLMLFIYSLIYARDGLMLLGLL